MPTLAVRASAGAAPRRAAAKASKAPVRAARDVRVQSGDAYGASGTSCAWRSMTRMALSSSNTS